jgi:small subunit ribosomal protein S8
MFFESKVANTLSAIRVGFISKHRQITIPASNYTIAILNKLQDVGCIETFSVGQTNQGKRVHITLTYNKGVPAYSKINLISKPSRRYTLVWRNVVFLKDSGMVIILSTSKGLLTLQEAYRSHVGGLVLFSLEC